MAPDPVTPPADPSIEDQIAEHMPPVTPPEAEGLTPGEAVETPPPDEQAPPQEPEQITVGERQITRAQADALLGFMDWVQANPDKAQRLDDYFAERADIVARQQEQQQPPQAPVAPVPPSLTEDELADLPEPVRAALGELQELRTQVTGLQQNQVEDQASRARAAIDQASANFAQRYELNADQVSTLQRRLGESGLFPSMVQAAKGDIARGAEDALEVIYFRDPANRQREVDRRITANQAQSERQRNASRLSGSSGSTPRTEKLDLTDPAQQKAAIAAAIREQANQGPTE